MKKREKFIFDFKLFLKMDKLWETLVNLKTKEEKIKFIEKLDPEMISALRASKNPYRKPIYNSKKNLLAFSFINLPKEYMKHMMMTAMVGFMYKMATEFQHASTKDLPSELDGELGIEISNLKKKYIYEKPIQYYKSIGDLDKYHLASKRKYEKYLEDINYSLRTAKETAEMTKLEKDVKKYEELQEKEKSYKESISFHESQLKEKEENILLETISLDYEDDCNLRDLAKSKLKIKKTREEREEEIQDYILDFLDYFFLFDPNNHVRTGYMPNYDEKIRKKIKENPHKFKKDPSGKLIITDKFEEYLVPPRDTFYSFDNYFNSNYDYIRQCTDDIYGPTEFESAILPYETFDNEKEYNEWIDKHRKEIVATVSNVKMMHWTFTEPFAKNRENIKSSSDKTRLIDSILEQNQRDENLAKNIMKKRSKKAKNGSVPFELNNPEIENVKNLKDDAEPTAEELEIKVYRTCLKKKGRRFRNICENFKFNIEAEKN